jgi:hypothetical protein
MAAYRVGLFLAFGLIVSGSAWAQQGGQGAMIQGGAVSRGHAPVAIQAQGPSANIYGDGGTALDGAFTELGITNSGTPFCITDVPRTTMGGYHQLCIGANSLGGGLLSYNAYNGAAQLPFDCVINGVQITNCLTGSAAVSNIFGWVNVVQLGADPTGVADSAPAFRAACSVGNRVIVVPPGTYLFASQVTSPYPSYELNPNVLCQNVNNLTITGYGATITYSNSANATGGIMFDIVNGLHVSGLTFVGNRTGLAAGAETVAMSLHSLQNFSFRDLSFPGNWGGLSAPFDGAWLADGVFDNLQMPKVGQCFDIGNTIRLQFSNIRATGADANGNSGTNQVGAKCFSFLQNTVVTGDNHTGLSIPANDYITVGPGNVVSNFNVGGAFFSGSHYSLHGNSWVNNVGNTVGPNPGIGVWLTYGATGEFSSAGHPVHDFQIFGDRFVGNGNPTIGGAGMFIDASQITNADQIQHVSVNATFSANSSDGLEALPLSNPGAHMQDIVVQPLCDNTAPQTSCLGGAITTVLPPTSMTGAATSFRSVGGLTYDRGTPLIGTGGTAEYSAAAATTGGTPAPTVASGAGDCGTSPSFIEASQFVGRVVVGSGANGGHCTVTLSAWTSSPVCSVWNESSASRQVYPNQVNPTTLQITALTTLSAGDHITYSCRGVQ